MPLRCSVPWHRAPLRSRALPWAHWYLAASSCLPPPSVCLSCAPSTFPLSAPESCRRPLSGGLFPRGPVSVLCRSGPRDAVAPCGGAVGQAQVGGALHGRGGSDLSLCCLCKVPVLVFVINAQGKCRACSVPTRHSPWGGWGWGSLGQGRDGSLASLLSCHLCPESGPALAPSRLCACDEDGARA